MIGDLYNKILILFLMISVYIFPNTLNDQNYIFSNFIPYQESKISVGLKAFNHLDRVQESFFINNWFTDNLYIDGSILSIKNYNSIDIAYSTSIGYAYNMDNKKFKNMIFMLGYNNYRFKNNGSDIMNMSYKLLFNLKFKALWVSTSYGIIDSDERSEIISLNFIKSIFDSFIFIAGYKNIFNEQNNLATPYLSLIYKI